MAGRRRTVPPFVLFTDLDGTVLDEDYRAGPAEGALRRLTAAAVPVVFCSSKTRAEQEVLRALLDVNGPFIVENGSAVLLPPPCADLRQEGGLGVHLLGVTAARCRAAVIAARAALGLPFRAYHEMDTAEIAHVTGLREGAAALARRRQYSETLVGLRAADAEPLGRALEAEGLRLSSGGRHHTVTGAGADKGAALRWLMARLRRRHRRPDLSAVAVGDSANDVPMLIAADAAFLVARPDGASPTVPGARALAGVGPEGFEELVTRLLAGDG